MPSASHFVTTDTVEKAAAIRALHGRWSCHRDLEIRVLPNRGRDLAPLLCAWGMEPAHQPVVLHLHSKVSSYDPGFGTAWRRHMLQQLLGGDAEGLNCARAIKDQSVGLIIPWPHPVVGPCCHWGPNFQRSKQLLALLGLQLKRFQPLSFPAGSFFWCAGETLRPLLELGLQVNHFAEEPIGIDGYLPHALERCLGFLPSVAGTSLAVAALTANGPHKLKALPDPLGDEQHYSLLFEQSLEDYLLQRPELYGGQAAHLVGPY